jgi:hypothetical protein
LTLLAVAALIATFATTARGEEPLPAAIAAPGAVAAMTIHAVGAQIYECASDKPEWKFREPIATLLIDGRTVGRHFAGPTWELADGSSVAGKVEGSAPGATGNDIPWLRLKATPATGRFADVTVIQRINTKGGALTGACGKAGELAAVPYSGDYVFLTKGQ